MGNAGSLDQERIANRGHSMAEDLDADTEIVEVEKAIQREKELHGTEERTKHVRVRYGIYTMRNEPGRYVVRVRIPCGIITPHQLERIAELTEKYGHVPAAHITTRQGIQIADVSGDDIPEVLRRIESAGLTTRRTGGNVVRNVVCCALAGVSQTELFDVTPYALAADQILRDHPDFQSMPRKIKISFEGCSEDHVRTSVSDVGLRAEVNNGQKGFRIFVGGGLGAIPMAAHLLEDFTPRDFVFSTLKAVLSVFDRHGNRANRSQARLKWLIRSRGIEWFRETVFSERTKILADKSAPGLGLASVPEKPKEIKSVFKNRDLSERFLEWKSYNLWPQEQRGYYTVMVRCPLGDLHPSESRRLAQVGERFSGGPLRLTIEQNVALRWAPESALYEIYEQLSQEGLSSCCAEKVMDITRCVGAEACISAITNPVGATRAIAFLFSDGLRKEASILNLRIRVSGCQNACSHHHLADIGLSGIAKKFHNQMVPHYSIRLGGQPHGVQFGQKAIDVPAHHVAKAVERILKLYIKERSDPESFSHFVERSGISAFKTRLEDLTQVPPPEQGPEFYRDLDSARNFALEAKEGECHA